MLREVPGAGQIVAAAQTRRMFLSRITLIGQIELPVIGQLRKMVPTFFIEDDLVETNPVALRVDVQLAHGMGLVSSLPERLGQGRDR